jgi:hypothetical protein
MAARRDAPPRSLPSSPVDRFTPNYREGISLLNNRMKMREIMQIVEGDVVPFKRAEKTAPDIGTRFTYDEQTYMVSGWATEAAKRDVSWIDNDTTPPPEDWMADLLYSTQQSLGPRKQKLVWCQRDRATHVTGKGIAGCVAPIDMIKVIGRSEIDQSYYDSMLRHNMQLVGQSLN